MAVYVDYAYYSETYKGTAIAEADFSRFATLASATIDILTFDRAGAVVEADTDTAVIDKIKRATCAVADVQATMAGAGGAAVQSERLGNYSVTYAGSHSEDAQAVRVAKIYLANTDLMFAGFGDGEYGNAG